MAKFHFDIMQKTIEWHLIRRSKVGGSASRGLFVDSDTLLTQLLDEATEDYDEFEESFVSDDMEHGNMYEDEARQKVGEYLGLTFKECGWIQHESCEILGISPDGITEDLKDAVEIKCPRNKRHIQNIREGVQKDNIYQVIHYFTVNEKLERLHWGSYRPTNKYKPLVVYTFTRDSVIDLGTKAKPQKKAISEWCEISYQKSLILEAKKKVELNKLSI
jgi:hypothetical protein